MKVYIVFKDHDEGYRVHSVWATEPPAMKLERSASCLWYDEFEVNEEGMENG